MIPGNPYLVKCPFCGEMKKVFKLISGNTFDSELWSDTKLIAEMLPQVSPVHKCNRCGKYYFYRKRICGESKDWRSEKGQLSYHEWKEAYYQIQNDNKEGIETTPQSSLGKGFVGNIIRKFFTKKKGVSLPQYEVDSGDVLKAQFGLIQAYNDYYYRGEEIIIPSEEEHEFIVNIIKDFIDAKQWEPEDLILKAELYRESGQMSHCLDTLDAISKTDIELNDTEKDVINRIKEKALTGDDKVFIVYESVKKAMERLMKEAERQHQQK